MPKQPNQNANQVMDELVRREPIFHRSEFGTTRADFEAMTAPEYSEIGASGKRYSRTYVLDVLEKRFAEPHEDIWQTSDFQYQELAQNPYLLTYTLEQAGGRMSRRMTIWRQDPNGWVAVYHQGTLVMDGQP